MELLNAFTRPLLTLMAMPMSVGDILGFVTGIICVWLTARANVWNFPLGIVNSAILGLVFVQQRLFADASLQIIFIALGLMGWKQWLSNRHASEESPVFRSNARAQWQLVVVAVVLTMLLWQLLLWIKGSAPIIDALITSLSLCAQWLLNRRQLENWLWWITVDVISIPLYWSRGLPLISLLYIIFLLLCMQGWYGWRKQTVGVMAGAPA